MPGIDGWFRRDRSLDEAARRITRILEQERRPLQQSQHASQGWLDQTRPARRRTAHPFGSLAWAGERIAEILEREDQEAAMAAAAGETGIRLAQAQNPTATDATTESAPPAWRQDPRANRIIDEILSARIEGGYVNDARDPGRATNHGITQRTLDARHQQNPGMIGFGPGQMPANVRDLTTEGAFRILKEDYRVDEIEDERLAHQVTDLYTLHSPEKAAEIVQRALDGVMREHSLYRPFRDQVPAGSPIGPRTRTRMNGLVAMGLGQELRHAIAQERLRLLESHPDQDHFPGWIPRASRFLEE